MAKPTPKTHAQELAEAQQLASRAAKEYALKKADADAAAEIAPQFLEALQMFEEYVRKNNIAPEKALVIASAVHSSVETRLLAKCGVQQEDTEEEMKRIADLQNAVHELSHLGKRIERRIVTQGVSSADSTVVGGPVEGVGKMIINNDDVSKGS